MKIRSNNFQVQEVLLSRIDWTDTRFRLSCGRPLAPLLGSIQAIGLQCRPVLWNRGSGNFSIVAGYRRLLVLQKLGEASVPAQIVSAEWAENNLLLYNFHENIDRGFNPVEQSWAVKKLAAFLEESELVRHYLPLLNLPAKREVFFRYLNTARISPLFHRDLNLGRLFPETIDWVLRDFLPLSDLILALFIFLHWGFQKQKEFLTDLHEISHRNNQMPIDLLFSVPVFEILQHSQSTAPQKGEALRKFLRNCRFPILTETEKAYGQVISTLGLDQRTRIIPPPFFEGGRYNLEIQFSTGEMLKESLEKIIPALEEGKLDQLP